MSTNSPRGLTDDQLLRDAQERAAGRADGPAETPAVAIRARESRGFAAIQGVTTGALTRLNEWWTGVPDDAALDKKLASTVDALARGRVAEYRAQLRQMRDEGIAQMADVARGASDSVLFLQMKARVCREQMGHLRTYIRQQQTAIAGLRDLRSDLLSADPSQSMEQRKIDRLQAMAIAAEQEAAQTPEGKRLEEIRNADRDLRALIVREDLGAAGQIDQALVENARGNSARLNNIIAAILRRPGKKPLKPILRELQAKLTGSSFGGSAYVRRQLITALVGGAAGVGVGLFTGGLGVAALTGLTVGAGVPSWRRANTADDVLLASFYAQQEAENRDALAGSPAERAALLARLQLGKQLTIASADGRGDATYVVADRIPDEQAPGRKKVYWRNMRTGEYCIVDCTDPAKPTMRHANDSAPELLEFDQRAAFQDGRRLRLWRTSVRRQNDALVADERQDARVLGMADALAGVLNGDPASTGGASLDALNAAIGSYDDAKRRAKRDAVLRYLSTQLAAHRALPAGDDAVRILAEADAQREARDREFAALKTGIVGDLNADPAAVTVQLPALVGFLTALPDDTARGAALQDLNAALTHHRIVPDGAAWVVRPLDDVRRDERIAALQTAGDRLRETLQADGAERDERLAALHAAIDAYPDAERRNVRDGLLPMLAAASPDYTVVPQGDARVRVLDAAAVRREELQRGVDDAADALVAQLNVAPSATPGVLPQMEAALAAFSDADRDAVRSAALAALAPRLQHHRVEAMPDGTLRASLKPDVQAREQERAVDRSVDALRTALNAAPDADATEAIEDLNDALRPLSDAPGRADEIVHDLNRDRRLAHHRLAARDGRVFVDHTLSA